MAAELLSFVVWLFKVMIGTSCYECARWVPEKWLAPPQSGLLCLIGCFFVVFHLWVGFQTLDWPAGPLLLDPSCGCVDRLRFCWRRFPPVERAARMCTLLILKNATMKGCFSSAPLRPTRPASLELMLSPGSEDITTVNKLNYNPTLSFLLLRIPTFFLTLYICHVRSYRCWSPSWPAGPGCALGSSPTGCWWQWCQTLTSLRQLPTACASPAGRGLPPWGNIND